MLFQAIVAMRKTSFISNIYLTQIIFNMCLNLQTLFMKSEKNKF